MDRTLITIVSILSWVGAAWAAELTDPTKPPGVAASVAVASVAEKNIDWHLTMIRVGGSGRHIVLNGELLREGDEIAGMRVVAIESGQVTLESDQGPTVLRLLDRDVRVPVKEYPGNHSMVSARLVQ